MIGVSARSYVAAGLATAITGVMVATPVLARTQVALPTVPSANVELSAFATFAERTVAQAMSEAAVEVAAARNAATSVGLAPQGTTGGVVSSPLTQAAAVPSVASGAATVPSASTNHASNATAVQGSNSVNAPAATAATLSPLQAIIALPLLLSAIPAIVTAQALETTGEDAAFGTVDVLAGLALGNTTEVNAGIALIGATLGDFTKATLADFAALQAQLAPFESDSASSANVVASALKPLGVATPSASAVTKTPAETTTTDTEASASSTSKPSTAAMPQTAPSSVTAAVKNSGATKTENAGTASVPAGTTSHVAPPSASSASASAPKHANTGASAPTHAAAHAKGGK